jgi:hypothetical protein
LTISAPSIYFKHHEHLPLHIDTENRRTPNGDFDLGGARLNPEPAAASGSEWRVS